MYDARKVSNFLLTHYDAARFDITNLRINKLLFFIHGWSLVDSNTGLIRNHFEAWRLGPVIPIVYAQFKHHGDAPIRTQAEYLDYAAGIMRPIPTEGIKPEHASLIHRVFEAYSELPTADLVALTHAEGAPWTQTLERAGASETRGVRIPTDLIRSHFLSKRGGGPVH